MKWRNMRCSESSVRQVIRIYFRASLITFALSLVVLARCPAGFPTESESLVALPLLYAIFWCGAVALMFGYSHTLVFGICFLAFAVAFGGIGFAVRSGFGRTALLWKSAFTWFPASFSVFLSASL